MEEGVDLQSVITTLEVPKSLLNWAEEPILTVDMVEVEVEVEVVFDVVCGVEVGTELELKLGLA